MDQSNETPEFEAPPPDETTGATAMRDRVSRRLFGVGDLQSVGRYAIERRLGAGGMGVVYAAFDAELSRKVAIKLVRGHRATPREQTRLRDEARALAQLSHPNVVQIHEVGVHADQIYVVMEHVEGQTLDVWGRGKSIRERLRCCMEAGQGLAAAHAVGILHRDVKPNNIVVGDDGRPRIVDFGLARASVSIPVTPLVSDAEQTSAIMGTPPYVAPELFAGADASPASDQFGFCVTVWEVLAGARPFGVEQLRAAAEGERLRPTNPLRPRWIRQIVGRGLAADPTARWPSVEALLDELGARPRRRTMSTVFVCAGVLAGVFAAAIDGPANVCPDPAPELDRVWNPTRAASIASVLAQREGRASELAVLTRIVDDHEARWIAARRSACRATRVQGQRSQRQLDLADACLDRALEQLDTLLSIIEQSPDGAVNVRRLLLELDDPDRCTDELALARQLDPPADLDEDIAMLRAQIDAVELQADAEPTRAGVAAQRVVEDARALGFSPVMAEALALDAKVAERLGDHERALAGAREAARLAKANGDARLEFLCLRMLVALTCKVLEDYERALDLVALMLGSFEQLGRPRDLLDDALVAEAELAGLAGDWPRAELLLRQALEHLLEDVDDDDLRLDQVELALANAIADQGRLGDALGIYERLLTRLAGSLGSGHPDVAVVHFNLAWTAYEGDEVALARTHIDHALEIQQKVFGVTSARLAPSLVVLGQIQAAEGDLEAALATVRMAWPLERGLPVTNSERGNSLRLEATLLNYLERYDEALPVHERLETELGPNLSRRERAMVNHTIGWLQCRVGQCERARPRFETALLDDDLDIAVVAQLGLAEIDLLDGDTSSAESRTAQALREIDGMSTSELRTMASGEARLLELRCAAARGEGPEKIRERIVAVRSTYDESPPRYVEDALRGLESDLEQ